MKETGTFEISLSMQAEAKNVLSDIASKNGFELNELCSIILSLWATHGGSIWMGRKWFVVDWPRKFVFLKKEKGNLKEVNQCQNG
jgi:hypothetical protein